MSPRSTSTSAVSLLVLGVDLDRIRVVGVTDDSNLCQHEARAYDLAEYLADLQLDLSLLLQSVLGNRLESLLDIDGFLGGGLKVRDVPLGLTPGHGSFLGHHAFRIFHVDLVSQDNKGEVFRVVWAGLFTRKIRIRMSDLFSAAMSLILADPFCLMLTWIKNSSLHPSRASKLLLELTSYTSTQQSAPR